MPRSGKQSRHKAVPPSDPWKMKGRFLILSISLVANAALGFFYVQRTTAAISAGTEKPTVTTQTAAPSAAPSAHDVSISLDDQTWSHLNAADDAGLVNRLRTAGFPPNMILALVNLRLRARYADLFKRLRPPIDYPYWRKNYNQNNLSLEDRAARRSLEREIADERRKLLGTDSDLAPTEENMRRERLYGNIPVAKTDQLETILRDYGDMASLVREQSKGIILPEDREQLALLEKEKRADLVALLTPAELAEYDMRASPTAQSVRGRLRNFNPTEEEYRAVVAVQLDFDRRYGPSNLLSAEQQAQKAGAEKQLNAQIKASLSPERFAEYEVKTDPSYYSMAGLVARYKVTGTTTDALVAAQRDLAQRYNTLRQDRTLDTNTRDTQLKMLAEEATTRLTTALGPDAFNDYKRNGGPLNSLLNRGNQKP